MPLRAEFGSILLNTGPSFSTIISEASDTMTKPDRMADPDKFGLRLPPVLWAPFPCRKQRCLIGIMPIHVRNLDGIIRPSTWWFLRRHGDCLLLLAASKASPELPACATPSDLESVKMQTHKHASAQMRKHTYMHVYAQSPFNQETQPLEHDAQHML